jgi:amino-acid N-acetyltransferase
MEIQATQAIVIEPVAAGQAPQVYMLLAANGLPEAGLREHLATTWVAVQAGHVVGSAALEIYGGAALLRSVAVDAAWRQQGLGRRLVEHVLDAARTQGIRRVYLLTETAGAYFARLGFRPVPRAAVDAGVQTSVEFVSACPQSALVMCLDLGDSAVSG